MKAQLYNSYASKEFNFSLIRNKLYQIYITRLTNKLVDVEVSDLHNIIT